jgi:transketolase
MLADPWDYRSRCETVRNDPAPCFPDRFFECYITEQQMVAAAVGMQVRGWPPYAATFAAFFTRAYDFIRMAAVSRASIGSLQSR